MKIYVKNLCSQKAISVLKEEMDRLNIKFKSIEFGEIIFENVISLGELYNLDQALNKYNLSLILNSNKLVTDIRNVIIGLVDQIVPPETNISDHLTREVGYNYAYLNMYFTLETGISIEKYFNIKSLEKMSYSDGTNPIPANSKLV